MSAIDFTNEATLTRVKQDTKAWQEQLQESFWSKFTTFPSKDSALAGQIIKQGNKIVEVKSNEGSPIKVTRKLESGLGAKFEFPFVLALTGKGIKGSNQQALKGTEENISAYKYSIELEEYAHAIKDIAPLGRKKALFDIPYQMRVQMASWGVRARDELIFQAMEVKTASTQVYYTGSRTSDATLTSSDKLTLAELRKVKVIAQTRANGARYIIPPIMHKGKKYYFVVVPTDVFYDLTEDSEYRQSLMDAHSREKIEDNPMLTGADAITRDGIVIYSSETAGVVSNFGASSDVTGGICQFFGANALCVAEGGIPKSVPDTDDYGRHLGLSFQMMSAFSKPEFNSIEYGSIQIRCARSNQTLITENISQRVEL